MNIWDPSVLFSQFDHECRIYGDDNAQTWAVVSSEDYQICIRHRWRYKQSGRNSKKRYLARNHHVGSRASRVQENYFLHEFILTERMGKPKPTPHHIGDHRDGDENNCTRENLRWATRKFNRKNIHGSHAGKEYDEEYQ